MSEHKENAKTAIINELGEILVLRRSLLLPHRPGGPDLPGGRVKTRQLEQPETAAWREVIEETGLVVNCLHYLGSYTSRKSTSYLFAAALPATRDIRLSHEHTKAVWMPRDAYPKLIAMPEKYISAVVDNRAVFDDLIQQAVVSIEPIATPT